MPQILYFDEIREQIDDARNPYKQSLTKEDIDFIKELYLTIYQKELDTLKSHWYTVLELERQPNQETEHENSN